MIMTNIDHHGISILRKFDGIDYCNYHGIMIISIYLTLTRAPKAPW